MSGPTLTSLLFGVAAFLAIHATAVAAIDSETDSNDIFHSRIYLDNHLLAESALPSRLFRKGDPTKPTRIAPRRFDKRPAVMDSAGATAIGTMALSPLETRLQRELALEPSVGQSVVDLPELLARAYSKSLSSLPLPPGLVVFMAALFGLALLSRRRRKRRGPLGLEV